MIRIFISSSLFSFKIQLRAYAIDPQYLKSACIIVSKTEAKYYKGGGIWQLYHIRKQMMERDFTDHEDYEYIGVLAEEDKDNYVFRIHYKKKYSPPLVELPLPDKKTLKKLGFE
jgi:hypothetical protein